MALTATILSSTVQPDGSIIVEIRFDGPNGFVLEPPYPACTRRVPAGTDLQGYADQLAIQVEEEQKREEKERALSAALDGVDPHTLIYQLITEDEMRRYVIQSVANISGGYGVNFRQNILEYLDAHAAFVDSLDDNFGLSNGQIGALFDPTANSGQVTGWRNFASGLRTSLDSYVQGIAEQDPS